MSLIVIKISLNDTARTGAGDSRLHRGIVYQMADHEAAGGRVVPLKIDQSNEYYLDLIGKLNGILFPGGGVYLDERSGYGRAARIIYDEVLRRNAAGEYYPLWGTCLGFEEIAYLETRSLKWITSCHAEDLSLPIELTSYESRMLSRLDPSLRKVRTSVTISILNQSNLWFVISLGFN